MKKFVAIALLVLPALSSAEVIATLKTQTGRMFLTDDDCPNKKIRSGFIASSDRSPLKFCWSYVKDDDEIYVFYEDGDIRIYPGNAFNVNKESKIYKETINNKAAPEEGTFL